MGANRTHDAERAQVLPSRLAGWQGYMLDVDCGSPRCGGDRPLAVDDLLPRWEALTVTQTLMRMACRRCGRRPSVAVMRRPVLSGRRHPADLTLVLWGARTDATRD